ncbi:MAG: peroxiredoxin, partial [Actinomycetes bacterium]
KAMTAGCTMEACHFRDIGAEYAEVGAQRVGISIDKPASQSKFDQKHGLGYPLLSDPDRSVARRYGVARPLPLFPNKRATFVIGSDRRVLAAIVSETDMTKHADEALDVLRGAHA